MNGKTNQPIKRYMPGLDGLRALSVVAVIAYHLNLKWAQGGLLGVGVFFVLSGYLITDQIILEWKTHKRLSIINFWIRRIRRLVPAMICMLILVAAWLIIVDSSRLLDLKGDFLSSIFYVNNWYLIFHDVSYFESFGPPSPIGHLWSLSIEEQFYLLWPLILVFGLLYVPRRGKMMLWILTCAALSTLAMAILYEPGSDPSRVYYGTDTRAFALLIGAALAVIWPSWKLSDRISSSACTLLDISGGLGIFVLIILINRTNAYDDLLYRGGFLYISILTAVIIAVLVHPASQIGKLMGAKPFVWIGKRSYSLYIWHYPVIILTTPTVDTDGPSFVRILMQIVVSLIFASLSYKYVEEPIRRGQFRLKQSRKEEHEMKKNVRLMGIILIAVTAFSLYMGTHSQGKSVDFQDLSGTEQQLLDTSERVEQKEESFISQNGTAVQDSTVQNGQSLNKEENEQESLTGEGITAIGDSVLVGVEPYLKELLPGIYVDGKVSRQMSQGEAVVKELKAQGKLGDRIIIHLGTNGPFNKKQLQSLLESLSDAERVVLVTTRVPKGWQDTVNANIKEVAKQFSNVKVVDWYSASQGKDDYFYEDGVHLKPEGSKYFASLLVDALQE